MKKTPKKAQEPMEQVDGRVDGPRVNKTLDEILGSTKRRYRQTSEEEYREHIKTLNLTDMQTEAQQRGLIPISDRKILEQRLIREFKKTSSKYFGTGVVEQPREISDIAKQILAAGR